MLIDRSRLPTVLLQSADEVMEDSPFGTIAFDLESLSQLPDADLAKLRTWWHRQPFPIIGVGSEHSLAAEYVDVVVTSQSELEAISQRIRAHPQAAAVLVQVLRAIEHLPPLDGLMVESLGYATLQSGEEFKRWLARHRSKNIPGPVDEAGPPVIAEREGDQLNLTLNRPGNSNAYTVELRDALFEMLSLVEMDQTIRIAKITAHGRCFSTGGELSEFGSVENPAVGHMIRSQVFPARLLLAAPERYHFHVHKACVGSGLELPACAGRFTAAARTLFWLPELTMGLIPGAGGCVSISRRIGRRRTAYMVLMNKKIDAQTALDWGLIDAISP